MAYRDKAPPARPPHTDTRAASVPPDGRRTPYSAGPPQAGGPARRGPPVATGGVRSAAAGGWWP